MPPASAQADNTSQSGAQPFRPRARIIKTLGEELITNEFIALQELVKNSYDADARRVIIRFEEPLTPTKGAIIVEDDGDGMTVETLRSAWMEPATLSKVKQKRSASGRRVTGEKGIGRFATARVATVLELTSVSRENDRRISARFDWGAFDDPSRYLDEITSEWLEEAANGAACGTTLRLAGLKDDWSRGSGRDKGEAFRRLRTELSRLVSPIGKPDFSIELVTPERFAEFGGLITPPAFLGRPPYWMAGSVDATGVIDAIYQRLGADPEYVLEKGEKPQIVIPGAGTPRCGPFSFEFRVWDRGREELAPLAREVGTTMRDIRRDLDAASGIGIYRDSFRVMLPEDADWLRLDLRRVQNPTMRLSNNQVVGVVSITRDENPGLTDQTNRQGIVDSPEFEDFRVAVKEVLSRLEIRRDRVRRPSAEEAGRSSGFLTAFDLKPLREYVAARYREDVDLRRIIDDADRSITDGIGEVKVVLARYRRLATLGQLVDVILHDGRTPVAAISNEAVLGLRDLTRDPLTTEVREKFATRLSTIMKQTQVLTDLFRRISPFSGRKRGRPRVTTIEQILRDTVSLVQGRLDELGVNVEMPNSETDVTVDVSEMQMLFYNLVDNAAYWLERVPEGKRRLRVEISKIPGELHVIVSDSGPGVDAEDRAHIFEPYFSTRAEGVGLGLAIAGEIALEYEGSLDLLADGPLEGATFQVTLRRRIGGAA